MQTPTSCELSLLCCHLRSRKRNVFANGHFGASSAAPQFSAVGVGTYLHETDGMGFGTFALIVLAAIVGLIVLGYFFARSLDQ